MAQNLIINGIQYNGVDSLSIPTSDGNTVKFHDLSGDTVTPETLAEGATAHDKSGNVITGIGKTTSVLYTAQTLSESQKAQARENIGVGEEYRAKLIQDILDSIGCPVFGVVDENNNIILSGNLEDDTYSVKYEMEDGSKINIGNLVLDTNVYYSVTKNLTNCTINNSATSIVKGESYSATISANDGYELKSVVVTMGGSNVSVSGGNINIANVTGDIVITAVATATATYTNILTSGEYEVTLNKRWSASSKAYSSCNGMISVKIPFEDVLNKTIYIKGFEKDLKASNSMPNWYALKSDNTKVTQLKGYAGSSGSGNVWECVSLKTLDNGVYGVPINSETITAQNDVAYLMVNMAAYASTAIGTTIPNTFIVTINEEIK